MDRYIETGGSASAPSAAGAATNNYPTAGNPGSGTPASTPGEWWFHMLTEEVRAVVVAGGLTPDHETLTQLRDAIQALIAGATWSTGDVKATLKTTADAGWVMLNDGTLGSASSGATTRANADTEALYTLLWNNISDTYAPVTTGRGANAAADFAANKPIALPKALGRALAAAGAGASLTSRSLGETLGAETHTLSTAELPAHSHNIQTVDGATGGSNTLTQRRSSAGNVANQSTQAAGSGGAHNNMQPSLFVNWMVKL